MSYKPTPQIKRGNQDLATVVAPTELEVLQEVLLELRILNAQLQMITNTTIEPGEVDN